MEPFSLRPEVYTKESKQHHYHQDPELLHTCGSPTSRYQHAAGRTAKATKSPTATEQTQAELNPAMIWCCCQGTTSPSTAVGKQEEFRSSSGGKKRTAGQPPATAAALGFQLLHQLFHLPCRKVATITCTLLAKMTKRDLFSFPPASFLF